MSGIYINMEMPEDSDMIVIYSDGTARKYLSYTKVIIDEAKAISVSPHGRLIDVDALTISTAVPLDGKPYQYVHIDNIKAAPTIIPAEIISKNEIKIIDTKGKSNYDPKHRFVIQAEEDTGIQKEFMQNWHEDGEL